ncbi:MAG: RDD family protein [Vicinamibacterales bacterium]
MAASDDYLTQVTNRIPLNTPLRARIALELRATIAERVGRGQAVETVLAQLGSPQALAESYLSVEPLVAATFWSRAGAKVIDLLIVLAVGASLAGLLWIALGKAALYFMALPLVLVAFAFPLYAVFSEFFTDQTVGKRLLGLRVVRESGARISLGQSFVRQLPQFLQVFWIDIMFALFTDRSQRAFELLSQTRVVEVTPYELPDGSTVGDGGSRLSAVGR